MYHTHLSWTKTQQMNRDRKNLVMNKTKMNSKSNQWMGVNERKEKLMTIFQDIICKVMLLKRIRIVFLKSLNYKALEGSKIIPYLSIGVLSLISPPQSVLTYMLRIRASHLYFQITEVRARRSCKGPKRPSTGSTCIRQAMRFKLPHGRGA